MEIDIMSLITGIIFFVIIFGTFGFLIWTGKRRIKMVKKVLAHAVKFHNLNLSSEDIWGDKALGLDIVQGKLLFVGCGHHSQQSGVISLSGCIDVHIESKDGESIKLTLEFRNRREVITLFTIEKDDPVEFGFHKVLADKWLKLILVTTSKPKQISKSRKVA